MEEAPAMAIRRSNKASAYPAVPLPPSSRRRRGPAAAAAAAAAWPAFPGEHGLGIGCAKLSPAAAALGNISVDGSSSRSPLSSSSRLASSGTAPVGAGIRRNSSDLAGDRVCIGAKSPGIGKKSCSASSCCDSCGPCSRSSSSSHPHKSSGGRRVEYDDVFGGPPKYLASAAVTTGRKNTATFPDYDDIFQGSPSTRHTSSSTTKSRTAELPVFDLPIPDLRDSSGGVPVYKSSPAAAASPPSAIAPSLTPPSEEIVYDDVFGGPLTGPRSKHLKDILRCSGFAEAKKKAPGLKSKVSSQSDSSPVSSLHSMCREPHGNPVYEYESEVYGDAKHFNSPLKSSAGSVDKSPQQQTFVGVESNNRKQPAVTSVSASSSPFTEHFDDSTVHSYSTKASKCDPGSGLAGYEKVYRNGLKGGAGDTGSVPVLPKVKTFGREVDMEVANSSSGGETSEQEYLRKVATATRNTYKPHHRKQRSSKSHRRPSRTRREQTSAAANGHKEYENVQAAAGSFADSSAAERGFNCGSELPTDPSIRCFLRKNGDKSTYNGKKQEKQVDFLTVNHVQLMTEPTSLPPARPAPSKNVDFLSEKDMSEFLETDAFMEYSIKDLDGLVAEEYVVSQESVSESSPSVSNSVKTSPSGRSYEDEDSDHCYAKDAVSPDPDPEPEIAEQPVHADKVPETSEREEVRENKAAAQYGAEEKIPETDISNAQNGNSSLEETSSSSSAGEQTKCGSDDLSSLGEFEVIEGENAERRRCRWERHQRAIERVAKVLAERNNRDLEFERIQEEKQRVAELLEDVIKRWAAGKQGNLRALLSTLQYILWPKCGWQPISLIDIIEPASVRKAYKKATLYVHPDKLQQKNASTEHKYIAEKVFDLLQEAWTSFNLEQAF